MTNRPLVSVIVPCYNHSKYVKECLLSVINQRYSPVQLIVIDDGSTDNSVEIIESLRAEHDFIFEAQQNIGLSATLNKAITQYATGAFIALLASDDFYHLDRIAEQVDFMEKNQHYSMVFSNASIVDDQSVIRNTFNLRRLEKEATLENLMLDKMGIPALTTLIKREVFADVGLFDEKLAIEDWDMWLRIAEKYQIGFIPKALAFYRMHDSNESAKIELMMENRFRILDKWKDKKPNLYKRAVTYWQLEAFVALAPKHKKAARKYMSTDWPNRLKLKYYRALYKYYFIK